MFFFFQERFRSKDLEELYKRYEQRAQLGGFSTYLAIQAVLSIGYITLVVTKNEVIIQI